jgi:hypothetical protein
MRTLDINEGNWMGSSVAGLSPWTSVTAIAVITKKKKRDFIVVFKSSVKNAKKSKVPKIEVSCQFFNGGINFVGLKQKL